MTFILARNLPEKPFNTHIKRFDPKYWTVDYNAEMVGVILPINDRSFRVPAQWRTNKDFLGVRWQSEDIYSHEYFRYGTDVNYRDTILAFRANPAEPHKFTCTITDVDFAHTYRLTAYVLDPASNRYVPLDTEYNTNRTYPASVFYPEEEWTEIPLDEMEYFKGRKDYIFILDFNDLRTSANYKGPLASPLNVSQISFDTVEWQSGLGRDATIFQMNQLRPDYMELLISGSIPGAKLTKGDQLQFTYKYYDPAILWNNGIDSTDQTLVVDDWDGFGTGTLRVRGYGRFKGSLVSCDRLYSRFLQAVTPTAVTDSNKYFVDFKITGVRQTIQKKHYPQPVHSIHMTSGFDDNYPQTPQRQVQMVKDLGYRDFWNVYIGMSHYFSGRCGYRDANTGEFLVMERSQSIYALFAGDQQLGGYFEKGLSPNRGTDTFRAELARLFDVTAGLIEPIKGTQRASAIDRACVPPGTTGYPYWWDLEANEPGPALKSAIAEVGTNRIPHVIVWGAGTLDLEAIRYGEGRTPRPSLARTMQAARAIWSYMRSHWKNPELPIIIQNQTWAWTNTEGTRPAGTPVYTSGAKNSWGDFRARGLLLNQNPAGKALTIETFDPATHAPVLSSAASGDRTHKGVLSNSVDIRQLYSTFGFLPNFWEFQYRNGSISSATWAGTPELDDSTVREVLPIGGGLNMAHHFDSYSGAGAARALVSANTLRDQAAIHRGWQVDENYPVDATAGWAYYPVDANADPSGAGWWNLNAGTPGQAALDLVARARATGRPVQNIVFGAGDKDIEFMRFQGNTDASRFQQCLSQMFDWFRAQLGENVTVWLQTLGKLLYHEDGGPWTELAIDEYFAYRDAQVAVARAQPLTKIGSWVPQAWDTSKYVGTPDHTWMEYTPAYNHEVAAEIGQAVAAGYDRMPDRPAWTYDTRIIWFQGRKDTPGSSTATFVWSGKGTTYRVINTNVATGAIISNQVLTANTFVFTEAEQIAAYGFAASNFNITVIDVTNGFDGVPYQWSGTIETPALPGALNLNATMDAAEDITVTWDKTNGTPAGQQWLVRYQGSKDYITTNLSQVITRADNIAVNGFVGHYCMITVFLRNAATGELTNPVSKDFNV